MNKIDVFLQEGDSLAFVIGKIKNKLMNTLEEKVIIRNSYLYKTI